MRYGFSISEMMDQVRNTSFDDVIRRHMDLLDGPDDCLYDTSNGQIFTKEDEFRNYVNQQIENQL